MNPVGVGTRSNLRVPKLPSELPEDRTVAVMLDWDRDEIAWGPALEVLSDRPDATMWAFDGAERLPNLWLQEHPQFQS